MAGHAEKSGRPSSLFCPSALVPFYDPLGVPGFGPVIVFWEGLHPSPI